ncbi:hypothetical protein [Anaerosacchariphilus polymeriproducens]|uniref:Uncharacterized protein n=1 Tax=Anaerosacchariphilus polymeriproducens TaxID=1812858 RepID=A0A371AUJ5_9FIRM|nr:hypothetical protein [Anaerosacchariphilus polymeriproducens]RDU23244.1 hypothetical protein DWV06_10735 [Anaerosacchariphilus polymeriproducens]
MKLHFLTDGLMHTLFALEDMYGLKITKVDGKTCLQFYPSITPDHSTLGNNIELWQIQAAKLEQGEITKEAYDTWRYNYPASTYVTEKLKGFGLSKIQKMDK